MFGHQTIRHTPQQNGVAEHMNWTLQERTCCMLFNASLLKDFWADAIAIAYYLVNCSLSSSIECKTMEEVWSNHSVDYSNLKIFGCSAYVCVDDGKLEPRSKKYIFVGYALGVKGYRLWCLDHQSPKIFIEKDVVYHEFAMLSSSGDTVTPYASTRSTVTEQVEVETEIEVLPHKNTMSDSIEEKAPS